MNLPAGAASLPAAPDHSGPGWNSRRSAAASDSSGGRLKRAGLSGDADSVIPAGSGLLLVDKPAGMTSHDVVARVRRLAGTRRVGHGGTLDPMATGLLVLGVNGGTKLLQYVTGLPKTYLASIRLGASTTTDDAEGAIVKAAGAQPVEERTLERLLDSYRGAIMQVPTSVSAIRVDGKRAHQMVRDGEDVKLDARPVTIHRFEILGPQRAENVPLAPGGEASAATAASGTAAELGSRSGDQSQGEQGTHGDSAAAKMRTSDAEALSFLPVVDVDVEVECSSGTYIRALARDVGQDLGVGGHLTALRRTTTGPWSVGRAQTLEQLASASAAGRPLPLISVGSACQALFSELIITPDAAARFAHGQAPRAADILELKRNDQANQKFATLASVSASDGTGMILGLVRIDRGDILVAKTVTVFPEGVA